MDRVKVQVHAHHSLAECGVCFAAVAAGLAFAAVAMQWALTFL